MLSARKTPSTRGRRGTTLQEMLVVLAILVSLVGSGWPAISGGLGKSQLRSGAKQLRAELAKARLTAIEQGVPYQFRYRFGTGHLEVTPLSSVGDDDADITPVPNVALDGVVDEDESEPMPVSELDLPDGVVFSAKTGQDDESFAAGDLDENVSAESEISLSDQDDQDWSTSIVFFPNGRTSNAQFTLQNEDGHRIMVTLRGLTGSATVGDVKKVEVEE